MKNLFVILGKSTALLSFTVGTLLLIQFAITLDSQTVERGFYFIRYTFYANCLIFVTVFIRMLMEKVNIKPFSKTLWLMLANLPVVVIYVIIAMALDNLSQVTCKNGYNESITNVELNWGEGRETWNTIEPEESFFERFYEKKLPVVLKYTVQNKNHIDTLYYPYPSIPSKSKFLIKNKIERTFEY